MGSGVVRNKSSRLVKNWELLGWNESREEKKFGKQKKVRTERKRKRWEWTNEHFRSRQMGLGESLGSLGGMPCDRSRAGRGRGSEQQRYCRNRRARLTTRRWRHKHTLLLLFFFLCSSVGRPGWLCDQWGRGPSSAPTPSPQLLAFLFH